MGREPMKGFGPFKTFDVKKANSIASERMGQIGIDDRDPSQAVGTMSGGERQCLAISRAIYFGAKVLILDESSAALDFDSTERLFKKMRELRDNGVAEFIVAAENADLFSALMPISPHHEPYSYLGLANKIKDIPILISHGDADDISSFEIASQMSEELENLNAEIIFKPIKGGDHFIYDQIYSDSLSISWIMNKIKN